jgi:adenylate cyclase
VLDPRSLIPLKGKVEPLPVFAVRGALRRRAVRLEEPTYVLPMVGRAAELVQVLGITAEAGMGKSRLVAEIVRLATRAGMSGNAVRLPHPVSIAAREHAFPRW